MLFWDFILNIIIFPKIIHKIDFLYIDPNNITFLYNPNIVIEKTLHFIDSINVSSNVEGNYSDYLYLDEKCSNIDNYLKKYINVGYSFNAKLYSLWSAFAKWDGSICLMRNVYKQCFKQLHNESARLVGIYDEVICIGNLYTYNNWGHTFQDFLQPLLLFPISILKKSKILQTFLPSIKEIISFFGISSEQIIPISENECIYCNIIHTITPKAFLDFYADLGLKLKNIFFEKFQLKSLTAKLYCFSNRPVTAYRHITNFDDIFNVVQNSFSNISFIKINDSFPTIKENAVLFAQIKFLFSATGSNLIKTYFMQNELLLVLEQKISFTNMIILL